jgi:ABC-type transport system involved in multi-copper enzyme maturation permease subunit
VILFALIAMVSFISSYMAGIHMKENLEALAITRFPFLMLFSATGALFSMVQFVAFFGPLIGLVLAFDSINRERADGTLIKLISQPIYRDAVINGKFLAGGSLWESCLVLKKSGVFLFISLSAFSIFPSGLPSPSCFPFPLKALPHLHWHQFPFGSSSPFSFPWEQMWWQIP